LFTEYKLPPEKAVQERRAADAVDKEATETGPDDRPVAKLSRISRWLD
jgi:hypothetical protein